MMRRALSDNSEDVVLAHDQITLSVNFHFCSPVFRDEDLVPLFHGELDDFSVFIAFARSESDYFPFLGFSLAVSGMKIPPFFTSFSSSGCTSTRSPRGLMCKMYIGLWGAVGGLVLKVSTG